MLTISCPQCRKTFKGKNDLAGRMVICPDCKAEFEVLLPADLLSGIPVNPPESESDPLDFLDSTQKTTSYPFPPKVEPEQTQATSKRDYSGQKIPFHRRYKRLLISGICLILIAFVYIILLSANPYAVEQNIVREYLKQNLDDSTWEEVQWFVPVELQNSSVWEPPKDIKTFIENYPTRRDEFRGRYWKVINRQGKAIRLKYRAKNKFGANVLCEEVFLIVEDEVIAVVDTNNFRPPSETVNN